MLSNWLVNCLPILISIPLLLANIGVDKNLIGNFLILFLF
jgi:hypothetical protein